MMKTILRILKKNKFFTFGLCICLAWVVLAICAPFITSYSPTAQDIGNKLQSPSITHIFGTDNFGRDIFSRVIYGARLSLLAGFLTVVLASVFGSIYGAIAGFVGGIVDDIMMRISEIFLSFPSLILAMIITSALGSSLFNTMLALVIVSWPSYAKLMRSVVLSEKQNEYVLAAQTMGASKFNVLFKEITPNCINSLVVMATADIGNQILSFSALSFLGLGSPPPTPEWGAMVSDGVAYFSSWWVASFPGLAILTMTVGANIVGDGIRDIIDPKTLKV